MRREHLYLQDILDACNMIQTFLDGIDVSVFLSSELYKATILQKLSVMGKWDIVWATANDDIPVLRREVAQMLQTDNSD